MNEYSNENTENLDSTSSRIALIYLNVKAMIRMVVHPSDLRVMDCIFSCSVLQTVHQRATAELSVEKKKHKARHNIVLLLVILFACVCVFIFSVS